MSSSLTEAQDSIIIVGHGSPDPDNVREFESLVALVRARSGDATINFGYLECSTPTIKEAVHDSVAAGARRVIVVPALLATATHIKTDLPGLLADLARELPQTELCLAAAIGEHPDLLELCKQRIIDAEVKAGKSLERCHECLLVVSRGTTHAQANAEISKLARRLEEEMGFGSSFVCFSGAARPLVADGLEMAGRLGFKRIVVLPYLLFDGVLVKRIYQAVNEFARRRVDLEVLPAGYLGAAPAVADVLILRARQATEDGFRSSLGGCNCAGPDRMSDRWEDCRGGLRAAQQARSDAPLHLQSTGRVLPAVCRKAPVPAVVGLPDRYVMHPIESESMRLIGASRDWSSFSAAGRAVAQRLIHASGDLTAADNLFFSPGAPDAGVEAILSARRIVCDVTMVLSGLQRALLQKLGVETWCGVHEEETALLAQAAGLTRSAAWIRRARQLWGDSLVLSIGDAPSAVAEATRLVLNDSWRPLLIVGLPVGFVGTRESKEGLRKLDGITRITNSGTRGGSPWAAAVINALMIEAVNRLAEQHEHKSHS